LQLTFLGTSAALPTIDRNVSGLAVKAGADLLLFDCGEGSQRQMQRFGVGFSVRAAFFTHFHADHYLGIIGFLRTIQMFGRSEPLILRGPAPATTLLHQAIHLGIDELTFELDLAEMQPGEVQAFAGYQVRAVAASHRMPALGYVIEEDVRPGTFDVQRARALGIPQGPLFGRLQSGESVTLDDGRTIVPADVLGPERPGRRVAISGDTRPTRELTEAARGAHLLVHEATFADEDQERALATHHSTAREAAEVGRAAGVKHLVLTHLSSRYDKEPHRLAAEASTVFPGPLTVAHDGLVVDVPESDVFRGTLPSSAVR
jgi:ribonuclease Z